MGTMLALGFLKRKTHSTTTFKPVKMEFFFNREKEEPLMEIQRVGEVAQHN